MNPDSEKQGLGEPFPSDLSRPGPVHSGADQGHTQDPYRSARLTNGVETHYLALRETPAKFRSWTRSDVTEAGIIKDDGPLTYVGVDGD